MNLRIQYASDFHLEFEANTRYLRDHPLEVTGDILVLAGDIHVLDAGDLLRHDFFKWCADHYEQTLIVPGNHEFYLGEPIENCLDGFEWAIASNVRYVNNSRIRVGDTDLLLTTLWSRIPPQDIMLVQHYLTDFHRSTIEGHRLTGDDYNRLHEHCLQWLEGALAASDAPRRVVVTHHCPVVAEDPRYESNGLTNAFIVPLENFIASHDIDAWIFGHTHYNGARGHQVGNTVMATNQLGYVKDGVEKGFVLDAVI